IGAAKYPETEKIIEALKKISKTVISFNATEIAEEAGNQRTMNVILLGALAATGLLPFDVDVLRQAIKEGVPPRTIDVNMKAFELGMQKCKEFM
ncbi:MAG: 2-oxoacid:acceptor oxidoreductase family protein, partial [Candidatus Ranarchaeia archaeon]